MNININNSRVKTLNSVKKTGKTKTKSNNNLDNNIRFLRKENGYTQEELAYLVGVSRQTINAIENSRMSPTLILAFRITEALGQKHIEDVFTFTENRE